MSHTPLMPAAGIATSAPVTSQRRPHGKARSVSSLPPPARTASSPILPVTRLPRSPPTRTRSSASPMQLRRVRSPTLPSPRAMLSPSKLPSTEHMSYFPPFESMGSVDSEADAGAGADADAPIAGPSRSPASSSSSSSSSSRSSSRHGKGRSLGSLAGLMSWATFSPSNTPANEDPPRMTRSPSDGEAVQALARRCSQTKRRTLEPLKTADVGHAGGKMQKRRNGSEIEVERMLRHGHSRSQTLGEEDAVERLVGYSRPPRPHLSLPPASLPNWRFPLPSPPVISLSPDIPIELFQLEISNPASTTSSPNKTHFARADLTLSSLTSLRTKLASAGETEDEGDIDEVDALTTSSASSDSPVTPDRPDRVLEPVSPPAFDLAWTPPHLLGDKLRRTDSRSSGKSCDSKETVRPREGEVTPKAGRGWVAA